MTKFSIGYLYQKFCDRTHEIYKNLENTGVTSQELFRGSETEPHLLHKQVENNNIFEVFNKRDFSYPFHFLLDTQKKTETLHVWKSLWMILNWESLKFLLEMSWIWVIYLFYIFFVFLLNTFGIKILFQYIQYVKSSMIKWFISELKNNLKKWLIVFDSCL